MKRALLFASLIVVLLLSACGAQATATPTLPAPTTAPTTVPASPTTVAASPTGATPATPEACVDKATFVADVTVPDYTHFDPKEAFTKTWRVKNAGNCPWTSDYKAVYSRGEALGAPVSIQLADTAPGATIDISANMVAPPTDGKFEIFYQLTDGKGDPMPIDSGEAIWALITVGKTQIYAPATIVPAAPTSGASGATVPGLGTASCVSQPNSSFVSQTLTLINAARAANGLVALTINDKLNAAAQSHSEDMACKNFLAHNGWNGSTPDSRIAAAGYIASITRENIYAQPPQYGGNPQAAVDWWMSDPIHRDAILNTQVTEMGVGYAAYSRSDLGGYFTVDFGAP